ncbi:MAG: hypothetical protein ACNA8P_10375, partial [Phycisphaerales bacterium]
PQIGDGRVFVSEWAGFVEELLAQDLPTDHAGALNIALRASWLNEAAMAWMVSDEQLPGARWIVPSSRCIT